jgi:hypothetical protein
MSNFKLGSTTVGVLQVFAQGFSAAEPTPAVNAIGLEQRNKQAKIATTDSKVISNYTALLLALSSI